MNYEIGFYTVIAALVYVLIDRYFINQNLEDKLEKLEKENSQIKKDNVMSVIGPNSFTARTQGLHENYEKIIKELANDIKILTGTADAENGGIAYFPATQQKYINLMAEKNKPVTYHLTKYF